MIFDAYAFLEKLQSEAATPANPANFAKRPPKTPPRLAELAGLAAPRGQNSKYADALDQASERAAIMQYDGGLSRRDAEHAAAQAASERWGVPVAVILEGMKS